MVEIFGGGLPVGLESAIADTGRAANRGNVQDIHQNYHLLKIINLLYLGGNLPNKPFSKLYE